MPKGNYPHRMPSIILALLALPTAYAYLYPSQKARGHWNPQIKEDVLLNVIDCSTTVLTQGRGETCGSVASSLGMTLDSLKLMNPSIPCVNGYTLDANTLLCVSYTYTSSDHATGIACDLSYPMQATDTCDLISGAYGVTGTNFRILNPTLNCFDTLDFPGNQYCLRGHYPSAPTVTFSGRATNSSSFTLSAKCTATTTISSNNQTCLDVIRANPSISVSLLALWNAGINCWALPNQAKVCIKGDMPVLPTLPARASATGTTNSLLANAANGIPNAVGNIAVQTTAATGAAPSPLPGSIASFIGPIAFNNALQACGVGRVDLYPSMVTGFVAPISGLKELAILLGNCAHESAKFTITTEIGCRNNPSACPYGWFYGRGYLQLSWEQNYLAAAKALGNPQIYSNPDIVAYDETVNWSTVQWFWQTIVQPQLRSRGMSLASSVYAINGKLECKSQGGGGIAPQRLSMTQCFEAQLGVEIDTTDWC